VRLPAFDVADLAGERLTDRDVAAMAPVLLVLLRGFA
jgi:hypothetical protein